MPNVAGSNPVFRLYGYLRRCGGMADTVDSKSTALKRHVGSTPISGILERIFMAKIKDLMRGWRYRDGSYILKKWRYTKMDRLSLTEWSIGILFAALVVWFSTNNINVSLLIGAFAYIVMWASANHNKKESDNMICDNRQDDIWSHIYKLEDKIQKCNDSCKTGPNKR